MTEEKKTVPQEHTREATVDGIKIHISPEPTDDVEVLQWLDEIAHNNVLHLPALLRRLTGDDYDKVMDHLRDDQGIVRQRAAADFALAVCKAAAPNS